MIRTPNRRVRTKRRHNSLRDANREGLRLERLECRRLLAGHDLDEPFSGSISGVAWEDVNANAVRDVGELGLADVRIYLDKNNNGRLDNGEIHTATRHDDPDTDFDEAGTYSLSGLDEGRHIVRAVLPRGFVQTFPVLGIPPLRRGGHTVVVAAGGHVDGVDFGHFPLQIVATGSVAGTKWLDSNENGRREDDEPGLPGVVIYSDLNNNARLDGNEPFTRTARDNPRTAANEAGRYELRLRPGNHLIREVVPEGFAQTFPMAADAAPRDERDDADAFVTTDPERLDLVLERGDVFAGQVSMTVHPFCILPVHVDVVASDPDINFTNSTGAHLNGCGGDVSTFEISITGDGGRHQFELLFIDPENGHQHASIPVTINARDRESGHRVRVRPGGTIAGQDFGNRRIGGSAIDGLKWLDANGNGQRDEDEPGLPGVTIYLDLNHNGRLDDDDPRTVTRRDNPATPEDETGQYRFVGLSAGEYTVREIVPRNHTQTFPGAEARLESTLSGRFNPGVALDLEISDVSAAIDAAGQLSAIVEVTVTWPDSCGALKEDETDQSIVAGQLLIEVHGHQVGDVCAEVETPTTESVRFDGLTAGRHDVIVTLHEDVGNQPDVATLNAAGVIVLAAPGRHRVRVGENELVEDVNFGNRADADTASVQGIKWLDRNGNGERDPNEPGIPGVTIYSDLNLNGQFDAGEPHAVSSLDDRTTEVDEAGRYQLADLEPGEHLIEEVLPIGFERTFPRPTGSLAPWPHSEPYFFDLVAGQRLTGIDFGNRPVPTQGGAVHGRKWVDANGNGQQDPGEPGLPGVTIYLDANLNNQFDEGERHVRTMRDVPETDFDEAGLYAFTNVQSGFYIVREVVPDSFEQTHPPVMLCEATFCQGRGHMINVEPGSSFDGLDFGNRRLERNGVVRGTKWLDQDGDGQRDGDETGLPGVTIFADLNLNGRRDRNEPLAETMHDDPRTERNEAGVYRLVLPAGEHLILEELPNGFVQTFPDPNRRIASPFNLGHVVNVEPDGETLGIDFGNRRDARPTGAVAGFKWLDRNANGEKDSDERGLPGVIIFSDLNGNREWDSNEPATRTRGLDGNYRLELNPGRHMIREVVPDGFRQTFPARSVEIFEKNSVNLPPGKALSFELVDAQIQDDQLSFTYEVVWPNGCGSLLPDRTEVRMDGNRIAVELFGTQIGVVCTEALKPEQHTVHIDVPPPGVYQLRTVLNESESMNANFQRSFTFGSGVSIGGDGGHSVVVRPGETVSSLQFGNTPTREFPRGDLTLDGRVDAADIDLLSLAIRSGSRHPDFDINADTKVNLDDLDAMVREVIGTVFGDANLDGRFNSSDLVKIFQAGKFEDGIEDNTSWSEGDFDGDGDFTSSDLVLVFIHGGFDAHARAIDSVFAG